MSGGRKWDGMVGGVGGGVLKGGTHHLINVGNSRQRWETGDRFQETGDGRQKKGDGSLTLPISKKFSANNLAGEFINFERKVIATG